MYLDYQGHAQLVNSLSSGGVSVGSSDVKSVSKLETSVSLVTSGLNGGSIWVKVHAHVK